MEREVVLDHTAAIAVLQQAGFTVRASGHAWHVTPPPDSPGAQLVPDGTVIAEWTLIALARVIHHRSTLTYRMQQASRWN